MSRDRPERPGVAALLVELNVRRHVRVSLAIGIAVGVGIFLLFAYLPGAEYPLSYWLALTFVLSFAVFALVASVLVARTAYRTVRDPTADRSRSPATLAIVLGVAGWALVPLFATIAFGPLSAAERLGVALVVAGSLSAIVSGIGWRLVTSLSLSYAPNRRLAAVGALAYTLLVVGPGVGCLSGGTCFGTPDGLTAAIVGLDPAAVPTAYAVVVLGGGAAVGGALVAAGGAPPHGFLGGIVAAIVSLPIVAAITATPELVRAAGVYLPAVLGTAGAAGGAVVILIRDRTGE